jgi:DNA-binding IclR family transcriptional regulator
VLIKSVHVSFTILRSFLGRRKALTLKEIGYQSGLPVSKAHRYLQSLIREGMIAQDPRTRLYRLGPAAIDIGLEALEAIDPVVQACETGRAYAEAHDIAVSVDVLGPHGPICVWFEQPVTHVMSATRLGTVQSLTHSAAGHVFVAFLPAHATRERLEIELGKGPQTQAEANGSRARCRQPAMPAWRLAILRSASRLRSSMRGGRPCAVLSFIVPAARQGAREALILPLLTAANEASAFKTYARQRQLAGVC